MAYLLRWDDMNPEYDRENHDGLSLRIDQIRFLTEGGFLNLTEGNIGELETDISRLPYMVGENCNCKKLMNSIHYVPLPMAGQLWQKGNKIFRMTSDFENDKGYAMGVAVPHSLKDYENIHTTGIKWPMKGYDLVGGPGSVWLHKDEIKQVDLKRLPEEDDFSLLKINGGGLFYIPRNIK